MSKTYKAERRLGQKVNVFRGERSTYTGREDTMKIHQGVVVAESTTHVQVYKASGEGKDVNRDTAEWFPRKSPRIWVTFEE